MTATAADHALAAELAGRAGTLLLAVREQRTAGEFDAEALKDEGDRVSHELLMDALAASAAAGDGVLSEEGDRFGPHAGRERVWVVDPLDGTREFSEPPRTDWAVHVALAVGGAPVCGAVALPALGVTLSTASPPALAGPPAVRPRLIVSRTRPPAIATRLAEQLDGELVELGSAGAKAMAIVRGEADVYAHAGGQYQWDSCAPVAVALAAGLHCSRLDGSPLVYGGDDPYLPDLLICHPALADRTLALLNP